MLYNSYSMGGFGVQILTRSGLLFFIWLACIAYEDFDHNFEGRFLVQDYYIYYLGYAFIGALFYIKFNVRIFIIWRFLLESFFCIALISFPMQVAYYNSWDLVYFSFYFLLIFYSGFYLLRFVFWKDFHNSLLVHEKLKKHSNRTGFYLANDGYVELYELNDKLAWLKNIAFWENNFFSKELKLSNSKTFKSIINVSFFIFIVGLVWGAVTGFNVYGLVSVVVVSLIIPLFMRVTIAPAFLDLILSSMYEVKDSIDF
ncbi:MAG: hypothetical protein HRT38_19045 [Alteromonadaceae bacterium]|nr:hypothetical protein [Alteromonadaceae bacterium]